MMESARRVLIVIPSITNYFTFLEGLTAKLIQSGFEVALASSPSHFKGVKCYNRPVNCQYFPIEIPQGMNPVAHLKGVSELRRVIKQFKPDIVHAHIGAAAFVAAILKAFTRKPIFLSTHHGLIFPQSRGWRKYVLGSAEICALLMMDQSYVLNESDKEFLKKIGIKKSIFLHQKTRGLGCRIDQFDPDKPPSQQSLELKQRFKISDDQIVFVFVGRLVWFKGFDLTVRAFFQVYKKHPQAKLIVAGEPYSLHPTGLDEIEMKELEEHPSIHMMGWIENVEDLLKISDVCVFPSEREGMPVNLMEAISMGVPAITQNTRGCSEIVEHNETGLIVDRRNTQQLQHAMEFLIEDRGALQTMKSEAKDRRPSFDRELWIEEQIDDYRDISKRLDSQ